MVTQMSFKLGMRAYRSGKKKDENPYNRERRYLQWTEWLNGWESAKVRDKPGEY